MIIAVLSGFFYLTILLWWSRGWKKSLPGNRYTAESPRSTPFVSVVIAVRNEATNIPPLLESLRQQSYPASSCEWIFVDDHSTDETPNLLLRGNDLRLRTVMLESNEKGKKAALGLGINKSRGEWIVTTDADCRLHRDWLSDLVHAGEANGVEMICGLVACKADGKFISQFQAMEIALLQVCGAGSLAQGFRLLNTGACLAFKKATWHKVSGYESHRNIISGDDTFLMLDFSRSFPGGVKPRVSTESIVWTRPLSSWKSVFQQRLRWMGKTRHYRLGYIQLSGALISVSAIAYVTSFLFCFVDPAARVVFSLLCLLRLLPELYLLDLWKRQSGQTFSIHVALLMSFLYPFFMIVMMVVASFLLL